MQTRFLGHHISATFELRAGVVKARRPAAAGRSEAKSLDDAEHSSTLHDVMAEAREYGSQNVCQKALCNPRGIYARSARVRT